MKLEQIRSNRKTLAIQILDGKVIVRAPLKMSQATIDGFVNQKQAWINKRLSAYTPVGFDLKHRKEVYIFGELKAVVLKEGLRFSVQEGEVISITKPKVMSLETTYKKVETYFKDRLITYLDVFVKETASIMNIKTPPFKVRRYKRIYGRCSSKHELAFNTYLFHESPEFIKAVVVHECAHIKVFDHSKQFYDLVLSSMPNYRSVIRSNKCGYSLHQDQ